VRELKARERQRDRRARLAAWRASVCAAAAAVAWATESDETAASVAERAAKSSASLREVKSLAEDVRRDAGSNGA